MRVLHFPEYRYHFKAIDNGFMGAHVGASILTSKMELLKHRLLRKGKGYFIEQPLDTKLKINDKFYLDCFLGGGWHQGFYKGYRISDGTRYDKAYVNKRRNPYRSVMISYKLN
jgi:hypothetical protein